MTIGAWILWGFLVAILLAAGYTICGAVFENGKVGILIGGLLSVIVLFGMFWWFGNSASGARAMKTQESNFNKGIYREITVYDVNGGVIQQFKGKFDIEYDDDRIMFDDENGLRHIIYYPTGTVIVDELDG